MDLALSSETWGVDDQTWLGSAHGNDMGRSITLVTSAFTAGTHYPGGFFKSGIPLALYTSGVNVGKWGPYTPGATDGTQTFVGYLLAAVPAPRTAGQDVQGALLDHGRIVEAKLPIAIDSAAKTAAAGRIWYV